ncbi:MAG: methyltransferase domain-containing protein [Clostridia bacterium]|nr:methyltransferase domain-containing protein [Clostridia bacterium]
MKHAPYGLLLAGSGEITAHEGFEEGLWFVQDEAAQLAVLAAGVKPGTVVVDACAAPGGKTLGMAMDMENRGSIHSFDVDEEGLEKLCASALRLGINCVTANKASSLEKIEVLVDAADTVFCDVPCSGFGVMGKKPDIRLKPYDEVKHLPAKQLAILENVSRYVRPGGTLLYATCTVLSEENEQVREAFLRKHTEFSPASFELPGFNLCDQLTFFPHLHGTDGFYIAKFIRKRCEA